MKNIKYNMTAISILALLLLSCGDMMDVHKEYIEDGEIIYAPKVDTAYFIAGRERALFLYKLYNSPNVKSVDVYWNGRLDSLIIPVTPTSGLDSFETVIPGLPEKSYTFEIRTSDSYGNKSLWETSFCNTYGSVYQSTLSNRRTREIIMSENGGEITWLAGAEGLVGVEVRYRKDNGVTDVIFVPAEENRTICPEADAGSGFEYRSVYIPEAQSIDTFRMDWVTSPSVFPTIFMYDRSKWTVHSCSDETASDGGGMTAIIDGDNGSYWHSQWDGGNMPLPHWIIIDLGRELNAVRFDLVRRNNNTDTKTVQLYFGNTPDADGGTWTKVAETVFDANRMEVVPTDRTTKGRYLKILFPDSNRDPFTNLAEIYMYGGN
jgi:hypothetical protein